MAKNQNQATQMTKADEPETAISRPEWLKHGDARGTEHITKDDLKLPRVLLAQKMSPQLGRSEPNYIPDLEEGDLFNDLTSQIYPKPQHFTIIRGDKPRYVEFFPREEGGGVKDPNVPEGDPRTKFGTDDKGKPVNPVATKFYDFVALLLPSLQMVSISFKGTSLNAAKTLNSLMKQKEAASFAGRYALNSAMQKNSKGSYAVYVVTDAGFVDKDTYDYAERQYESIKDKKIDIRRDGEDVVDAEPVDTTATPGKQDDVPF